MSSRIFWYSLLALTVLFTGVPVMLGHDHVDPSGNNMLEAAPLTDLEVEKLEQWSTPEGQAGEAGQGAGSEENPITDFSVLPWEQPDGLTSVTSHAGDITVTGPEKLTFDELRILAKSMPIAPSLDQKVKTLLNTPFIYHNKNAYEPLLVEHGNTGPSVRVASWNIERGFNAREIATLFTQHAKKELAEDDPPDSLSADRQVRNLESETPKSTTDNASTENASVESTINSQQEPRQTAQSPVTALSPQEQLDATNSPTIILEQEGELETEPSATEAPQEDAAALTDAEKLENGNVVTKKTGGKKTAEGVEQARRVMDGKSIELSVSKTSRQARKIAARLEAKDEEWDWLSKSQILMLTEVDNGLSRTKYEDITKGLAERLGMHAVYGTEFLELGPLSDKMLNYEKAHHNKLKIAGEDFSADPKKYTGLHGMALLTRYPILDSKVVRLPQCYDWYKSEQKKITLLERLKRSAVDKIWQEVMLTELRKGSRMALLVDLEIPNLPEKKATFVVTHLENRAKSKCRLKQLSYLLNEVKDKQNPVVIAGDLNTSGNDTSPTSVRKEIRNMITSPSWWTRQAIGFFVPFGYAANAGLVVGRLLKNWHNPATPSIPLLLPNPEYSLFTKLNGFRFADGEKFDLRGDSQFSYNGRNGYMSNSNQRALKGFVPTFTFERPVIIGTFKLDWFLVKPQSQLAATATDEDAIKPGQKSRLFAPTYARTLSQINKRLKELEPKDQPLMPNELRLSDHDPLTVDLPLVIPYSKAEEIKENLNRE